MSITRPRWIEKFTSADELQSYVFPRYNFESDHSQAVVNAYGQVLGADYPVDMLAYLSAPKGPGQETVRFALYNDDALSLSAEYDTAKTFFWRMGKGKLWSYDGATRRWAWARAAAIPDISLKQENFTFIPVSVTFDRLSDWFDATENDSTRTVVATPTSFTVTNGGAIDAQNIVFRFMANAAGGINNPKLTNLTTGESFSVAYVSTSVNSEVRVDTRRYAVETSENNGTSYASAYSALTLGPLQVGFMRLIPGDNTLQYTDTGTPNLDIEITFNEAY